MAHKVGSSAKGVLKGLKGSKVVDEYTLQIELSEPNTGFIEAIASLPNYSIMSLPLSRNMAQVGQHVRWKDRGGGRPRDKI